MLFVLFSRSISFSCEVLDPVARVLLSKLALYGLLASCSLTTVLRASCTTMTSDRVKPYRSFRQPLSMLRTDPNQSAPVLIFIRLVTLTAAWLSESRL